MVIITSQARMRFFVVLILTILLYCPAPARAETENDAVDQCMRLLHGLAEPAYSGSLKSCLKMILNDPNSLAGKTPIETILVSVWAATDPAERDTWRFLPVNRDEVSKVVIETLKESRGAHGITIKTMKGDSPSQRSNPKTVDLIITVTSRSLEHIEGDATVIGSLTAVLSSEFQQGHSAYYDRAVRAAVPFIVTSDKFATLQEIKNGIKFLAPGLFNCIKSTYPTNCEPERPWSMKDNQ